MKRFSLLAILTTYVFSIYAYDFQVGDFYYKLSADGSNEVEIVPMETDSVYVSLIVADIPEWVSYNNLTYRVAGIGDSAFMRCHHLTELHLPSSITRIGKLAFNHCTVLKKITIPASIQYIGDFAFEHCDSLYVVEWNSNKLLPTEYESLWLWENRIFGYNSHVRQVIFGDSVQTIPLQLCSAMPELQSVLFKGNVLHIENSAFEFCPQLSDVVLPNSLLSLGTYSFSGTGLKEITVPAQCTQIGEGVFSMCEHLRYCHFEGISTISGLDVSWFDGCRDLQIIISDGTIVPWW